MNVDVRGSRSHTARVTGASGEAAPARDATPEAPGGLRTGLSNEFWRSARHPARHHLRPGFPFLTKKAPPRTPHRAGSSAGRRRSCPRRAILAGWHSPLISSLRRTSALLRPSRSRQSTCRNWRKQGRPRSATASCRRIGWCGSSSPGHCSGTGAFMRQSRRWAWCRIGMLRRSVDGSRRLQQSNISRCWTPEVHDLHPKRFVPPTPRLRWSGSRDFGDGRRALSWRLRRSQTAGVGATAPCQYRHR